jgi:catechol 2,3-dioxygenase-like lactoylglutathione lyase family enzyme
MAIEILQTIPLLRIFSVDKAKEFYVGFLGFRIDWEHRFDDNAPFYLQVTRAGCVLHLTEHHGDCCPGATVFVWMTGLDAFPQEITAKGYAYLRPGVEPTFYGARCMEVIDPFGNRIRFNEKLPPA